MTNTSGNELKKYFEDMRQIAIESGQDVRESGLDEDDLHDEAIDIIALDSE